MASVDAGSTAAVKQRVMQMLDSLRAVGGREEDATTRFVEEEERLQQAAREVGVLVARI